MALLNSNNQQPTNKPSYWSTKEGKYGAWGLFFIAVIAAIGIKALLPWIISFTTDLLHAGFLLSIVGLIVFLLTRERTRSMIWYQYKALMQWASNGFVKKNYLKIMTAYIDSLNEKIHSINASITDLAKQKGRLEKEAEKYKEQLEQDLPMLKRAKAESENPRLTQEERDNYAMDAKEIAERIGTYTKTVQNRQAMINRLDLMYKVVRRMQSYATRLVRRITDQVTVKEEEFKSISAAHKAFTNAWGIAYGQDDKRELFNMSMKHITALTGEKVGDMDTMMEDFKTIMRSQDLENAGFEEAGFKALEEFEKKHAPKMDDDLMFLDPNLTVDDLLKNTKEPVKLAANAGSSTAGTKSKYMQ